MEYTAETIHRCLLEDETLRAFKKIGHKSSYNSFLTQWENGGVHMKLNLYLFHKEMAETIAGSNLNSDWNNPKIDYACLLSPAEGRYNQSILYISDENTLAASCNRIIRQLKSSPSSFSPSYALELPPKP